MWKMSFCDSDQKSMPIVGFLTCNGSGIFCGPKLVPIGGLDTELISRLQRTLSPLHRHTLTPPGYPTTPSRTWNPSDIERDTLGLYFLHQCCLDVDRLFEYLVQASLDSFSRSL